MNLLYDDIVHSVQNTIDSSIISATDRHGYLLGRRFTKVSEITQCNGHYAVQGHFKVTDFGSNRKLIYDFLLVINTNLMYLLSCIFSKLWLIIGQIFASERGCLTLTLSRG